MTLSTISISELRNILPQLTDGKSLETPVCIAKHGQIVAAIIGVRDLKLLESVYAILAMEEIMKEGKIPEGPVDTYKRMASSDELSDSILLRIEQLGELAKVLLKAKNEQILDLL